MILKHVAMKAAGKSDFAGLVQYITDSQSKDHRLGQVTITNCVAESVRDAITEALATQHTNTRATGDKTYHLLIGFAPGENPAADTLMQIEERVCAALGYSDHQRVSAVHNDTDHLHIHLAINKIHPSRHTMHEPFQAYRALAEVATKLEEEYGLQRVDHRSRRSLSESRAADMEQHSGIESLVGWIRRECLAEIRSAQSWQELHQVLRDNGLNLRERANGLVIATGDGTTMVKASTVARALSKPKLEARLGPFQKSPEHQTQPRRQYQKDPIRLRVDTSELYARYKAEQQTLKVTRAQELEKARARKDRLVAAAKRSNRLRRATIKVIGESRPNRALLYTQASQALIKDLKAISAHYQQERQAFYDSHRRQTWADWLKTQATQGNGEALAALRAREAAQGIKGDAIKAHGQATIGTAPVIDNITKKGTIIYRAGTSAVRDDGDKLQVSRETTREGLHEALRLATERYGNRISVTGTAQFKAQVIRAAVDSKLSIMFADPELERRRMALLTKETPHEQSGPEGHRGRAGRRAGGAGQRAAFDDSSPRSVGGARAGDGRSGGGRSSIGGRHGTTSRRKPNIGRVGRVPPPQSQNRLRTLSQLGVVHIAMGSEVLLPRDVPGHVEQQRTESNHELRRRIPSSGLDAEAAGRAAADKYIAEREAKRVKIFDIPKHGRYTSDVGAAVFHGVRVVDGRALALLKHRDEVLVMPIDEPTARRLSRVSIGAVVSITPNGSIKLSKGRGR